MLENAYIIYKAPRYDIKGKEILKTLEKYYIVDAEIRNNDNHEKTVITMDKLYNNTSDDGINI